MSGSKSCLTLVMLIFVGLVSWVTFGSSTEAQTPVDASSQTKPAVPAKPAKEAEPKVRVPEAQNVTLIGRLVDLHSFMLDSYPNADRAKTTADALRAGVPAGLDTAAGLIVLGMGTKNPVDKLAPLAYQEVEVKGKLYLRRGARYLALTSIVKAKSSDPRAIPAKPPTLTGTADTKPAAP